MIHTITMIILSLGLILSALNFRNVVFDTNLSIISKWIAATPVWCFSFLLGFLSSTTITS